MWIEEIYLESFGACRKTLIRDLGPRLTVVVGQNEAGKTTVAEFIRSVLFGFKRKSGRSNIYEGPEGVPRSGRITVISASSGRLVIQRSEKQGFREGLLTITGEQGNEVPTAWTHSLVAGLDRSAYENLFAFDLEGMRRLDQEALRKKILATALGSVAVNPLEIRDRLAERLKSTVRCPSREGESLWSVQERLAQVDARIRELGERPVHHARLRDQLTALDVARAETASSVETDQKALYEINGLLGFEDQWKRTSAVMGELQELADCRSFPADGVHRLQQAREQEDQAIHEVREAEQNLEYLRNRVANPIPDETILDHGHTIEALSIEARNIAGRPAEIAKARDRVMRSQGRLDEEIKALGIDWNRRRIESCDVSVALEQEIRSRSQTWKEYRETLRKLALRHSDASERCQRQLARIEGIRDSLARLAPRCAGHLSAESLLRLQEWRSNGRRISEMEERLGDEVRKINDLATIRQSLDQRIQSLRNQSVRLTSPTLFWLPLILAAVAGTGMIYLGWRTPDPSAYVFMVTGACLWLSVPVAVRWKILWERRERDGTNLEVDTLVRQAAQITGEIVHAENNRRNAVRLMDNLRKERTAITLEVLGDPEAGAPQVMKAEALSRAAEEPKRRHSMLAEALQTAEEELLVEQERKREIEDSTRHAEQESLDLQAHWCKFVLDNGLDPALDPDVGLMVLDRLRNAKTLLGQLREDEQSLSSIAGEWEEFCAKVRSLGAVMGLHGQEGESAPDRVFRWQSRYTEVERQVAEKHALMEEIGKQELQLGVSRKRLEGIQGRIDHLMHLAGVSDEESFREKSVLHQRRNALEHERRILVERLVTGLAYDDDTQMMEDMAAKDWNRLHQSASEMDRRLSDLRKELEAMADRRGRLSTEIETLEAEEETERLLQERQSLLARIDRMTRDWIKTRFSLLMMEKTLRIYELEKQPKVLEKSSRMFEKVTGGLYTKIVFPLDSDQVKVVRCDRVMVDDRLLSRSTLEQVCLALRLAHLEVHGPEESIPVLVDDILVNFDQDRAARTVEVLVDFSERTRTQVLFFTCHQHIAGLFPHAVPRTVLEPVTDPEKLYGKKAAGEQVGLPLG